MKTSKTSAPSVTRQSQSGRLRLATLADIARAANVSMMTVSRVLANRGGFSEETRKRIIAVAEKMRYRPNQVVAAFQTGRTHTVAMMLPVHSLFCSAIAQGAHDVFENAGYSVFLASTRHNIGSEACKHELRHVHRFVDRRVDGFLIRPVNDEATEIYYHEIHERRIPMVAITRELPDGLCDFVGTDDWLGGRLAAEHLYSLGHRRFGHISGMASVSASRLRRLGFEEMLRDIGGGATCVTIEGGFEENREAADALLAIRPPVTAVFAVTDWAAASVYEAAAARGLRIPKDLSVVGFADLPFARFMQPPLTTVAQNPAEIGRRAAELLLKRITENRRGRTREMVMLPATLVTRQSTAGHLPIP